jgi:hypothetical protein
MDKDGNLLFLADLSGGSYDRYPEGIVFIFKKYSCETKMLI